MGSLLHSSSCNWLVHTHRRLRGSKACFRVRDPTKWVKFSFNSELNLNLNVHSRLAETLYIANQLNYHPSTYSFRALS